MADKAPTPYLPFKKSIGFEQKLAYTIAFPLGGRWNAPLRGIPDEGSAGKHLK